MKREIWVYISLMLFVAAIGSIQMVGITLPSPALPLAKVFEPWGKMILKK
jgi:hypothetical protein